MKFGIVNRAEDGLFRYQAWPTVCIDREGILYAASSAHRLGHVCPFGKNHLYVSCDQGEHWSVPSVINDTVLDDRDAGLTAWDGKLLLTYFNHPISFYVKERKWVESAAGQEKKALGSAAIDVWQGIEEREDHPGSFVRLSEDGGKSWGRPVKVPVSSPHGPTVLSDGRLLFVGKEFYSGCYETGKILAFESRDDGRTWQYLSDLEFPDGCTAKNIHEPHAVELPDGRILCALRGQEEPVAHGFSIYLCSSEDGGKSWSHPTPTNLCGSPPHLLVHSSGALVMTYARRKAPYGERAVISYDGGRSFGEELVISQEAADGDIGYPSTVELPNGELLTVYYQKAKAEDRFCSILYTKWSLPEKGKEST